MYSAQLKIPTVEYLVTPSSDLDSSYNKTSSNSQLQQPSNPSPEPFNYQEEKINNFESKVNTILVNLQTLTDTLTRNKSHTTNLVPLKRDIVSNKITQKSEPVRNYRKLVNPEHLLNASSPVGLVDNIENRIYGKRHDLIIISANWVMWFLMDLSQKLQVLTY